MGQKFYFQDSKDVSSLFIGGLTPILSSHIRLLYNVILTLSLSLRHINNIGRYLLQEKK